VTDGEVVEGIKLLAETEGVFAETAGGVVTASLKRLAESGAIDPDETTVAFITGGGLKTQEAVTDHVIAPLHIAPTVDSFEEKLVARRAAAVA
jgi:threonine synthase